MKTTITAVVCAYNEASYLAACLHSLRAQTRPPDEIIVIDNASTDTTGDVARAVPGVIVIRERLKGLVIARETARLAAHGDLLAYVDADCRAPLRWLESVERHFVQPDVVAVSGPYRFYDWDVAGPSLIRLYDWLLRRQRISSCTAYFELAPFSTEGISQCVATPSSASAGSIAPSSSTEKIRTWDGD